MDNTQVVRIDMPHGDRKKELPKKSVNYHRELAEKGWRKGLKPLTVTQPEGPSFTVRSARACLRMGHVRLWISTEATYNTRLGGWSTPSSGQTFCRALPYDHMVYRRPLLGFVCGVQWTLGAASAI